MKNNIGPILFSLLPLSIFCQQYQTPEANRTAEQLIARVQHAQQSLTRISYTSERRDTLVTGDTRTMHGTVIMQKAPADSLFGFLFRAIREGAEGEVIYDGHAGYITRPMEKKYRYETRPASIKELLYNGGGQMVVPDLVLLDTSKAISIISEEKTGHYLLTLQYADLTTYGVTDRIKEVCIDKKTNLPLSVRMHQNTEGRVQDLYYQINELKTDSTALDYPFLLPPFLKVYAREMPVHVKPDLPVVGDVAPAFSLQTLNGKRVESRELKGKAVLLDFWEVWCGPCIESMPHITQLQEQYAKKGLVVYGVINDLRQSEPTRRFIKRTGMPFETLVGNEQLKKEYKLGEIPMYIVISKTGRISFAGLGYSPLLEEAIRKAVR